MDLLQKVSDVITELSQLTLQMNEDRRRWEAPTEDDQIEDNEEPIVLETQWE